MNADYVSIVDGLPWIITSWGLFLTVLVIRGSRPRK